jgi:hypothetical protein
MNNYKETLLHDLLARVAKLEEEQRDLFNCHHFVVKAITERLEKLEARHVGDANKKAPVATDEELCRVYNDGPEHKFGPAIRAVYNFGVAHGQAGSREVAEPANVTRDRDEAGNYLIIHDTPTPPPKPPSLKEQALERLMNLEQGTNPPGFNDYDTIRRALEAIPE